MYETPFAPQTASMLNGQPKLQFHAAAAGFASSTSAPDDGGRSSRSMRTGGWQKVPGFRVPQAESR